MDIPIEINLLAIIPIYVMNCAKLLTPWRNGSASDSRSEGCVFKSRRGQLSVCLYLSHFTLASNSLKKTAVLKSCVFLKLHNFYSLVVFE